MQADCPPRGRVSHASTQVGRRMPPSTWEEVVVFHDDIVCSQGSKDLGKKDVHLTLDTTRPSKVMGLNFLTRSRCSRLRVEQAKAEAMTLGKTILDLEQDDD